MKQNNFIQLKRITIFLVCVLFVLVAKSQQPQMPKSAVSPNASSLGLYGEIPVSLFTGTPSIDIPIDQIKCGDITMPVSLSYHSAGIRPDQHPGWVGLGWTLQAGGMISRVVKGLPDDHKTKATHRCVNGLWQDVYNQGYYYSYGNVRSLNEQLNNPTYETIDSEPDEFSFNFPGYSGKFYLDVNGQWAVECNRPVKVEYTGNLIYHYFGFVSNEKELRSPVPNFQTANSTTIQTNSSHHFTEFTITDEYGNKYVFGDRNTCVATYSTNHDSNFDPHYIEYSIDFFNQSASGDASKPKCEGWHATSWMLKKIIATNSEEISFDYSRGPFVNQLYRSIQSTSPTSESGSVTGSPLQLNYGGQLISPVYLSSIAEPNGKNIRFEKSNSRELAYDLTKYQSYTGLSLDSSSPLPSFPFLTYEYPASWYFLSYTSDPQEQLTRLKWQKLDDIKIYHGDYLFKNVTFEYSNNSEQRLTLKDIVISSGIESSDKQKYSFDYYHLDKLPPYLSEQVDHWGFFNGSHASFIRTANSSSLSTLNPESYFESRNASRDTSTITAGALKRITYPTGGTTVFEYEANEFGKMLGESRVSTEDIQVVDRENWPIVAGGNILFRAEPIAGGLRIKKITSTPDPSDANQNPVIKEYSYLWPSSNISSGVNGGLPQYYYQIFRGRPNDYVNVFGFSSQSILPMCENSGGGNIGYTFVTEKIQGSGSTHYMFSNFDNGFMDAPCEVGSYSMRAYPPTSSKRQDRGNLLLKTVCNENGYELSQTEMEYIETPSANVHSSIAHVNFIWGPLMKKDIYGRETLEEEKDENGDPILVVKYAYGDGYSCQIFTHSRLLSKKIERTFNSSSVEESVAKQTTYIYNSDNLLSFQTETDNSGDNGITMKYTYPSDLYFAVSGQAPTTITGQALVWWEMVRDHFLNYPIEITKIKSQIDEYGNMVPSTMKVVQGTLFNYAKKSNYKVISNNDLDYLYAPVKFDYLVDKTSNLPMTSPLSGLGFQFISASNRTPNTRYVLENQFKYDIKSQMIEVAKKDGVTTYLWDCLGNMIAEVKNISYNELKSALQFSDDDMRSLVTREKLDDVLKTSFSDRKVLLNSSEYNTFGLLTKIVDPRCTFKQFDYDANNRLNLISKGAYLKNQYGTYSYPVPWKGFKYHYYNGSNH